MKNKDEIERILWQYIDGDVDKAARKEIADRVSEDANWRSKYNEQLAVHNGMNKAQLEQPSMRFTKNVMDAVASTQVSPATQEYVNKGIVRGVALFFGAVIIVLLGVAVYDSIAHENVTAREFTATTSIFNGTTIYVVVMVNIVLALAFADKLLKRHARQQRLSM